MSGGNVTVPADVSIPSLTISGGGLAGPGNVTVGNQMTWSGGRLTGIGTLDIAAGAVMDVMGTSQLDTLLGGKTINNRGTINSTGWGIGLGSNDAGTATINNLSGATFNAIGDGDFNGAGFSSIDGDFSFGGVFNNAGTFRRSGAGTTTFGSYSFDPVSFNNTGSVNVQTGMLTLSSGSSSGDFQVAADARLDFSSSTSTLDANSSISGLGTVSTTFGGTANFGGSWSIPNLIVTDGFANVIAPMALENLTISGGGLAGPGNVTVSNQMTWSGGRLTGIGTLDVAAGAVMDVMGTSQLDTLLGGKTINNRGTINSTGWGIGLGSNDAGTATINNLSGATFNAIGDGDFDGAGFSSIDGDFSIGGVFNNAGTFRRSGAGTTTFGSSSFDPVSFNNTGSVNVQAGMLTLSSGSSSGDFQVAADARLDFSDSTSTLDANSSISGLGTVSTTFGGTANFGGSWSIPNLIVTDGFANVIAPMAH